MEWIELAVFHPKTSEIQQDGRVRKWAYIEEEGKYLLDEQGHMGSMTIEHASAQPDMKGFLFQRISAEG